MESSNKLQTPTYLGKNAQNEENTKKSSAKEFIAKAQKIHGNKYDYSKIEYKNTKTKICIICPKHGEFWQTPNSHLSGHACPKCGKERTILSNVLSATTFIAKAQKIHGNKYDYSKIEYKNTKTKICIICPKHGEFWQTPNSHLSGKGCPKCGKTLNKSTAKEFIDKARRVHGSKYDYSKVNYINTRTKICIICPKHGEFWQTPNSHLYGHACPKCGKEHSSLLNASTIAMFIKKANEIHHNKYDYSKVDYINSHTKVCIICPEHGKFWQKPNSHLTGDGCPKCATERVTNVKTSTTEEFINKARKIHGSKYDYSKMNYLHSKTNVCIICPKHGEFWQMPNVHLQGHGCPKCAVELQKITNDQFIKKAQAIHKNKYNYSKINYINNWTKVCIVCPKHGEFYQTPINHLNGRGCPKCTHIESAPEKEIAEYLSSLIGKENIILRDRKILHGKELDIYVPKYKTAIEFDGLYWHTDTRKSKYYHLCKTETCEKRGINLIHIFEDEWNDKKEIVLSILNDIFDKNKVIIQASKTLLKEIGKNESQEFFENNYIKGISCSKYNYGIYYNNKLEYAAAFRKINKNNFNLLGICHKPNIKIQNGEKLLLNYFIKKYTPHKITILVDKRWNYLNYYKELNFHVYKIIKPEYYYFINGKRINKKEFSKHVNVQWHKYHKIYDCGQICYKWENNNDTAETTL